MYEFGYGFIGVLCKCIIPANLNPSKVGHHNNRIEDKVNEGEKKKLTSHSNRFSSSSSTTDADAPPVSTRRRRSRSTR